MNSAHNRLRNMQAASDKSKLPDLTIRDRCAERRKIRLVYAAVAVLAIVMGWPTLDGAFLGGDDIQLARDHVLVNHPSCAHVREMFSIVHRDLYQPVALFSYSINVAIGDMLGFRTDPGGERKLATLFHLTNVLLHAVNAVLVFALVRRLLGNMAAATVAAALFAIHPLNVETVAWISGRMMLLSTMFVLWAACLMENWRRSRGWWQPVCVVVLVALAMMSKVRVSLPVLMLVGPLIQREWPRRNWWIGWGVAAAVTAAFAWINIETSSGMLERGETALQGSRIARTVLALSWYLTHAIVPVGLSPFHPAEVDVTWSHPGLPVAFGVLVGVAAAVAWSARRTRIGWVGALWLLAAIAVTLPLVPSRNTAVAERYTYLPHIGLFWMIAALLVSVFGGLRSRWGRGTSNAVGVAFAGLAGVALLVGSWRLAVAYESDVSRDRWVAARYPQQSGLQARLAWSLYRAGAFEEAIETAKLEFARSEGADAAEAHQVIGSSLLKLGNVDGALVALRRAVDADPENGRAYARLAKGYEVAGDVASAVEALRQCAELAPNYNPGLLRWAELLRSEGRSVEARAAYDRVLANNPYDAIAAGGLAEIDIAEGHHAKALQRLESLLAWMPENVPARINAGVCMEVLGDTAAARTAYETALQEDPTAKAAVLNLARLLVNAGAREKVHEVLSGFLSRNPTDRAVLDFACRNAMDVGALSDGARLLVRAMEAEPTAADLRGRYAWYSCVAGQWLIGGTAAHEAVELDPTDPWARLACCVSKLYEGDTVDAKAQVQAMIAARQLDQNIVFDALAGGLQSVATAQPDSPWPYLVLTVGCLATDRQEAAQHAAKEFRNRAADPEVAREIDEAIDKMFQRR